MDLAGYRPTLGEVAALLGKSSRWISDLRAKGDMPEDGATLKDFLDAWLSHSGAAGGVKAKPIDLARVRREIAKAEREEITTAALKGEMLKRSEVVPAVQGAFARVRSKLLSLPSKLAPRVATMTSAVEIEETLTELVHEALAELAATSVGVEEASPDRGDRDAPGGIARDGGGRGELVAGADAAAEAASERVGRSETVSERRSKRRAG